MSAQVDGPGRTVYARSFGQGTMQSDSLCRLQLGGLCSLANRARCKRLCLGTTRRLGRASGFWASYSSQMHGRKAAITLFAGALFAGPRRRSNLFPHCNQQSLGHRKGVRNRGTQSNFEARPMEVSWCLHAVGVDQHG